MQFDAEYSFNHIWLLRVNHRSMYPMHAQNVEIETDGNNVSNTLINNSALHCENNRLSRGNRFNWNSNCLDEAKKKTLPKLCGRNGGTSA